MIKTQATITHIEYSASGEVTFVRFQPVERFEFKEGQFVMIESIFNHKDLGKPLKKPYSIATTQAELDEKGTVGVIVKKTMDGYMSEYLTQGIKVGAEIIVTGPLGHMVDDNGKERFLLVSTGSGVSPMVGLFQELSKNQNNIIVNIFGERYHRHMLSSVEKVFSTNTDNIKNILFLSQDEHPLYRHGHVQLALDESIQFLGPKENITVFICGSPIMVDDVRQMLTERGFAKEQMKFEKY